MLIPFPCVVSLPWPSLTLSRPLILSSWGRSFFGIMTDYFQSSGIYTVFSFRKLYIYTSICMLVENGDSGNSSLYFHWASRRLFFCMSVDPSIYRFQTSGLSKYWGQIEDCQNWLLRAFYRISWNTNFMILRNMIDYFCWTTPHQYYPELQGHESYNRIKSLVTICLVVGCWSTASVMLLMISKWAKAFHEVMKWATNTTSASSWEGCFAN